MSKHSPYVVPCPVPKIKWGGLNKQAIPSALQLNSLPNCIHSFAGSCLWLKGPCNIFRFNFECCLPTGTWLITLSHGIKIIDNKLQHTLALSCRLDCLYSYLFSCSCLDSIKHIISCETTYMHSTTRASLSQKPGTYIIICCKLNLLTYSQSMYCNEATMKPHEQILITKVHIASHTNLILWFNLLNTLVLQ